METRLYDVIATVEGGSEISAAQLNTTVVQAVTKGLAEIGCTGFNITELQEHNTVMTLSVVMRVDLVPSRVCYLLQLWRVNQHVLQHYELKSVFAVINMSVIEVSPIVSTPLPQGSNADVGGATSSSSFDWIPIAIGAGGSAVFIAAMVVMRRKTKKKKLLAPKMDEELALEETGSELQLFAMDLSSSSQVSSRRMVAAAAEARAMYGRESSDQDIDNANSDHIDVPNRDQDDVEGPTDTATTTVVVEKTNEEVGQE